MWRYALLGTASVVVATNRFPDGKIDAPSSTINVLPGDQQSVSESPSSLTSLSYVTPVVGPSIDVTTVTVIQAETPSNVSYATIDPTLVASPTSVLSEPSDLTKLHPSIWSTGLPPSPSQTKSSDLLYPYSNSTKTASAKTVTITSPPRGDCTGCALAALNPFTTSYLSNIFGNWTSLVVTETVLTNFITYVHNSTIDTIVTEVQTVNQTKTVNQYITETAAEFYVYLPTPGTGISLPVGPTYVIYQSLYGGADVQATSTARNNATDSNLMPAQSTCKPHMQSLKGWIPTRSADWSYFIQTFANGTAPDVPSTYNSPVPIPTKLQTYLAQDPDVQVFFQGADIATCTQAEESDLLNIIRPTLSFALPPPPASPTSFLQPTPQLPASRTTATRPAFTFAPPPAFSSIPGTNTYLSTTFISTSKYLTVSGCLRCDTNPGDRPQPKTTEQGPSKDDFNGNPGPTNTPDPKNDDTPNSADNNQGQPHNGNTQGQPPNGNTQGQPQNTQPAAPNPDTKTSQNIPGFISSVISNNPDLTRRPDQPTGSGQTITIGDSVVTVHPQPTDQGQGGGQQNNNGPTKVIIGTQTVTVGQTTTINGVPVIVPTSGGGSTIIVGDKTIGINPGITPAPLPVLTVGHNTITANPQGQFVVGTQTLQRGGPAIILDDHTLTLGPNNKIAIWNSDTQTVATMLGAQPALTFGGAHITAQVAGGTTLFVLGSQTLLPGGSAVVLSGTTYSLPAGFSGTSIVVNGATQRLSPGLPVLTLDNTPITASVSPDGVTAFVLAPGQTLLPGGPALVIAGTTYSLPASGAVSTILINNTPSSLPGAWHLPVLTLAPNSPPITGSVQSGTTAFIFGPGTTLTPGGVLTVSGTTISYPASASGSVVVINGVTSTLNPSSGNGGIGFITSAVPIVVDGTTLTATTHDGTTERHGYRGEWQDESPFERAQRKRVDDE
ncbi:hypothetical protein E8E13_007998 [Curvularia kusanoi]|uniref:Uncharacterized protein n=1 Tax=Curvularia kusanoi TaxID=90978 RepID=A0A9P4TM98_CURKU|nr:hypothetical protein E8E13_007998 [Curvularia kusanoi]